MADEGGDEGLRHRLVVLPGITDVCEDLRQRLFVIDAHKVSVLFEFLFIFIIGVDVLAQIIAVGLLVDETL